MVDLVGATDASRVDSRKKCVGLARKVDVRSNLAAVEGKNSQSNSKSLKHQMSWAVTGSGVLHYDADNSDSISETREYIFNEWDPSAADDMAALRSRFDINGDGKLTGAKLNGFKVMVTNADGSLNSQTVAQLGITELDLRADATMTAQPIC